MKTASCNNACSSVKLEPACPTERHVCLGVKSAMRVITLVLRLFVALIILTVGHLIFATARELWNDSLRPFRGYVVDALSSLSNAIVNSSPALPTYDEIPDGNVLAMDEYRHLLNLDSDAERDVLLRHQSPEQSRMSSFPFVSGDSFRAFSDVIFDETVPMHTWVDAANSISAACPIVFLKTDYIQHFFDTVFGQLKQKIVLITHNSDYSAPGSALSRLDDSKLFAWFGQNMDTSHPKLFPIPIGFANRYWGHGDINTINATFYRRFLEPRPRHISVHSHFSVSTNGGRQKIYDHFRAFANSSVQLLPGNLPFADYLSSLTESRFTASPLGNGLDCHRTWEALTMGSMPILQNSSLYPLFSQHAPKHVIITDDMTAIAAEQLDSKFKRPPNAKIPKFIFIKYWYDLIRNAQEACRKSK